MAGKSNLVVLGVGPNEFLVRADDTAEGVRAGLAKMLGDTPFEMDPLTEKQAATLEGRLTPPQLNLLKGVAKTVGVSLAKQSTSHFVVRLNAKQALAAVASPSGVIKFNPAIDKIKKPLPGGIGPVGVTVGVGIAGKF